VGDWRCQQTEKGGSRLVHCWREVLWGRVWVSGTIFFQGDRPFVSVGRAGWGERDLADPFPLHNRGLEMVKLGAFLPPVTVFDAQIKATQ